MGAGGERQRAAGMLQLNGDRFLLIGAHADGADARVAEAQGAMHRVPGAVVTADHDAIAIFGGLDGGENEPLALELDAVGRFSEASGVTKPDGLQRNEGVLPECGTAATDSTGASAKATVDRPRHCASGVGMGQAA